MRVGERVDAAGLLVILRVIILELSITDPNIDVLRDLDQSLVECAGIRVVEGCLLLLRLLYLEVYERLPDVFRHV